MLAPIACGIVGKIYGLNYAFALSTIGMISGIVVFILGQKHLKQYNKVARTDKRHEKLLGMHPHLAIYLFAVILIPIIYFVIDKNMDGVLLAATGLVVLLILVFILVRRSNMERKHMVAIFIAIFFMMVFEAFLGQGGTTLNLFIEREVNRQIFGYMLPPSFFYSLDPIFMLIMGPILAGVWMRLARKGKEPQVIVKFAFALFLLALGFLVFTVAAHHAAQTGSASLLFVILGYFLFPVAELMIIPISLSLVTKVAPKGLDALMVGIWMLSNAGASYFTGQFSKVGQVNFNLHTTAQLEHAAGIYQHAFGLTAEILVVSAVVLLILVPVMKRLLSTAEDTQSHAVSDKKVLQG